MNLKEIKTRYKQFEKTLSPTLSVELAGQIPLLIKRIELLEKTLGGIIEVNLVFSKKDCNACNTITTLIERHEYAAKSTGCGNG